VVQGSTGAWARVTPTPTPYFPGADLHIYGTWSGEVAVRLPDPAPGQSAAVIHDTEPGNPSLSWGASVVREPTGTIVSALHSLSGVLAENRSDLCLGQALIAKLGHDDTSLFCANDSPRDIPVLELAAERGTFAGQYVASLSDPGPCPNVDTRAQSSGGFPLGVGCDDETASDHTSATWTFTNNTASHLPGVSFIDSFGAVYREVGSDPSAYEKDAEIPDDLYGSISGPFAEELVKGGWLLPGASTTVKKLAGSGNSTFNHTASGVDLGSFFGEFQILELADASLGLTDSLGITHAGSAPGLAVCFKDFLDGGYDSKTMFSCVTAAVSELLRSLKASPSIIENPKLAKLVAETSKSIDLLGWGLIADSYATSYITQTAARIKGGKDVTINYLPEPHPIGGGGGATGSGTGGSGIVDPGSLSLAGDGRFIARTPDGQGYLYNPNSGRLDRIADGFTFLCYATRYVVVDQVAELPDGKHLNFSPVIEISGFDADRCLSTPFLVWNYGPIPAGNTPLNVILRGPDSDGQLVSSWLINSAGQIQTIPNGGIYQCLAASNPVIWNVPFSKIQAWQAVGTAPASCG
jgi:hypothetical protein